MQLSFKVEVFLNTVDLFIRMFCSVESRKCFNCLNADYTGPASGLLSLQKCADFDPDNGDIVKECVNSDRCYIASLDETL